MLEMKKQRKSLNDVIPNWLLGQGIMSALTTNYDVPWKATYEGSELSLDIAYQGSHSGHKTIAPFIEYFLDKDDPDAVLNTSDVDKLAMAVWATYHRKWEKLWELYMMNYNPLHNYDMITNTTEGIQSTGTKKGTVTNDTRQTFNNSDTTTKTGTSSEIETGTIDSTNTDRQTGTQTNLKELNTKDETTETTTYNSRETLTKSGHESEAGTNFETHENRIEDQGTGDTKDYLFGFNSSTRVDSEQQETETGNTRNDTGEKISSSQKIVTYALEDVKAKSGSDMVERDTENTGNVTDTRTDDLTSTKAQSSLTTVETVLTNNLTDTTAHTGTINTLNTLNNNLTDEDEAERTLTELKHGNIGIASIQRMFKEEVENWKWNYMNDVFADLDAMLVLAVH